MSGLAMPAAVMTSSGHPGGQSGTRGQLLRYIPWQVADFATARGVPILVLGVLMGMLSIHPLHGMMSSPSIDMLSFALTAYLTMLGPLFVFLSVCRIVSSDRISGAFRVVFSKPVSVPRFYAQLMLVHALVYGACWLLLIAIARIDQIPAPILPTLEIAGIMFAGFGGFYFLISVITRHDLWVGCGLWIASYVAQARWQHDTGVMGHIVRVLPPAHRLGAISATGSSGVLAYEPKTALWVAGYGLACFVVGVILLARRPLAAN